MKTFAMILVVLGVCVGALGASGFHRPMEGTASREDNALPLFAVGATALAVGGFLVRQSRKSNADPEAAGQERQGYLDSLETIQVIVAELEQQSAQLGEKEVRDRISQLMASQLFDLTSRSDDLTILIGFDSYAKVWEGVAIAERLLMRCWSMCTDGYPELGFEELPHARKALDQAVVAMREVVRATPLPA